ncbi:hypothetical protein NSQ80_04915 [Paenibacillus sp. FSL K6-2441]|uniref:hypothetical protein n=1 Tax=unclassified Paenibacillus TaxID=185978 RepID=UPI0002FBCE71|nr:MULTISPECIES: hypothetical protein [unclassified Paenibacillus]MCT2193691.1 hypothetical protein [Paenibacillus sp. p3-SID1389]
MMRQVDLSEMIRPASRRKQKEIIRTSVSLKPARLEAEIKLLARSVRSRFLKSLSEGRIQINSEREWTLR